MAKHGENEQRHGQNGQNGTHLSEDLTMVSDREDDARYQDQNGCNGYTKVDVIPKWMSASRPAAACGVSA